MSSTMALSRIIQEIHMAVLDQYELVSGPKFPRHRFLHVVITGDEVRARVVAFSQRFFNLC